MNGGAAAASKPPPETFEIYLDLSKEEIRQLVVCLMIEEALRTRLAVFRAHDLPTQPAKRLEEFCV
jgi:hypothetical protein